MNSNQTIDFPAEDVAILRQIKVALSAKDKEWIDERRSLVLAVANLIVHSGKADQFSEDIVKLAMENNKGESYNEYLRNNNLQRKSDNAFISFQIWYESNTEERVMLNNWTQNEFDKLFEVYLKKESEILKAGKQEFARMQRLSDSTKSKYKYIFDELSTADPDNIRVQYSLFLDLWEAFKLDWKIK